MRFWLPAVLALCGYAGETHLAKPGVASADMNDDRLHCQGMMYADRTSRGRSAPNWNLYEYCMWARGYVSRESRVKRDDETYVTEGPAGFGTSQQPFAARPNKRIRS